MSDLIAPTFSQNRTNPKPLSSEDTKLMDAAKKLEASFLAEMLKSAGFGKSRENLGGGAGEDQFGSFLVQAQAEAMVEKGGIGLAQSLFEALKESENE
ncbi:hypothetical protein RC74_06860 [Falsihalocynthiibacter arcticus]|uniref:Flagellar protein FlgJ N-terminal domain-containing protein n=2 Tax=Roseobacteraceae TaxID=2854170 RepID=A0A126UY90_9RHOB|nr:hypothetical protein RC74_06860 [Falsihalocynthiibacter arcticus]